jgi:hypothetical protein
MKRSQGHIAFAFCLLFAFPIVWQTVHMYNHAHHRSFEAVAEAQALTGHEGQCPICAYEFAKYEDGEHVIVLSPEVHGSLFLLPEISLYPDAFSGFNLSLRGPPLSS